MPGPIILVDNDVELIRDLDAFLKDKGFSVIVEPTGRRGAQLIKSLDPILVILDIVLPDVDGLSICRDVRLSYSGPILVMTAVNDDIDEVASLETGADCYLNKPIQPRVLLAHIRALLRRHQPVNHISDGSNNQQGVPGLQTTPQNQVLSVGNIRINPATRSVWMNDQTFDLTSGEFDILWQLASHAGQIMSRDELYYHIRGIEYDGVDRAIDQHISNIRKKIGDNSKSLTIIKSVRGVGYILAG